MVKKYFVQMTVFVGFVFFILNFHVDKAFVANQSDLHKLMEVVQKSDGNVTEWSVFARDDLDTSFTIKDLEQIALQWEQEFPQFTWEKQLDDNRWVLTGTAIDRKKQLNEKLQIAADLNSKTLQGFVLYELKGKHWNQEVTTFTEQISSQFLPSVFQNNTPILFSSVKGNFGNTSSEDAIQYALQFNEEFNGKIVEKLAEENFVSLTTNSTYFENQLQSVKGSFNMQIAVRTGTLDEETTFAIGTPILTIEY